MKEGSLEAPVRHALAWHDDAFYDGDALDAELRRVFDVCHGCRRCFNLCDSFPRLFDLIDESRTGELDSVGSDDFKPVVDACTLCDMCFMTKCPYVPPHEFNIDFPHLMLRYRAAAFRRGEVGFADKQLARTDRNGTMAAPVAPLANWATRVGNKLTRPVMEATAGIHRDAYVPGFTSKPFAARAKSSGPTVNREAPAFGRKAVIYATCFANFNEPDIAAAARAVLARNGVETEVVYPGCCGMPRLEQGDIAAVAESARMVSQSMSPWIEDGYDVVGLVPSCTLMMKFEWPLILPDDDGVQQLSAAAFDISEYVVDIAAKEGLADGLRPLDRPVALHMACHARAQNMGRKADELLRLIPDCAPVVVERCSGHGGAWGIKKQHFDVALKVGRPVARKAAETDGAIVTSECPLAGAHILQGMERVKPEATPPAKAPHPIELLARAYGLADGSH